MHFEPGINMTSKPAITNDFYEMYIFYVHSFVDIFYKFFETFILFILFY